MTDQQLAWTYAQYNIDSMPTPEEEQLDARYQAKVAALMST